MRLTGVLEHGAPGGVGPPAQQPDAANTDTNHLLQLLEAHDGLVILSTNRRANIDPAFIRRLRHVVEFPKSGPTERRDLWHRMLAGLGTDPAPIKGAALSALYSALHAGRAVTDADLHAATEQELTKEGRAASASTAKPRRQRSPRNG